MRFKQYINEITKPTIKNAIRMVNKRLGEIGRVFEKNGWQISDTALIKTLNAAFKNDNLYFSFDKRGALSLGRHITSAFTFDNPHLPIVIKVKQGSSSYFRRFTKPGKRENFFKIQNNEFFKELTTILAHELIHVTQNIVSRGKSFGPDEFDPNADKDIYLSDPMELDAFAQGAAIELLDRGESNIMKDYQDSFETNHPTYKKFIKKLYKYIRAI